MFNSLAKSAFSFFNIELLGYYLLIQNHQLYK